MTHSLRIPKDYKPLFSLFELQEAIKTVKDTFQANLNKELHLQRVSAPLVVDPKTGLNDDLNGVERPVTFDVKESKKELQIVHSLAKWKRFALKRYGFSPGQGLYTDMNAIRRDEETDNLHSIYVDQWDWEMIIEPNDRTMATLEATVRKIMRALKETEDVICKKYPQIEPFIPDDITFISSQELEDKYPHLTPKQRENAAAKEYGAVFITQIGGKLKSGKKHDGRAPDYDDWTLNGDIIIWYPILNQGIELSSMGIRVDKAALERQLQEAHCEERKKLEYHRMLLNDELPQTIGGGIGQSRICLVFLHCAHIGEVQSSVWPEEMVQQCAQHGIIIL